MHDKNDVATSSGSTCSLVSLIQTGFILFYMHKNSIHLLKV